MQKIAGRSNVFHVSKHSQFSVSKGLLTARTTRPWKSCLQRLWTQCYCKPLRRAKTSKHLAEARSAFQQEMLLLVYIHKLLKVPSNVANP